MATTTSRFESLPVPLKLMTAGSAACFADFASFPLDTAKVRLQVQGEGIKGPIRLIPALTSTGEVILIQQSSTAAAHYRGLLGTIGTIVREEGPKGLYNGLNAGLQRQMCFASVRLGMYEPVKATYQKLLRVKESGKGGVLDFTARIMAGMTTGGMAVLVAQPTDVVKVRFQAQMKAAAGSASSAAPRYTGTWQAYKTIFAKDGVPGLWKGTLPNVGRNAIVTVAEIVCYDVVKETILRRRLMNDNVPCHFASATISGFCATLFASPVDVVKTRYMNAPTGQYRGAFDCAVKTMMGEGPAAFYKGFLPSFSRLVSWNIVMWISYEQLKRFVAQKYHEE